MRGTRRLFTEKIISTGLIPTYAGNTGRIRFLNLTTRAHPHVCGEHGVVRGGAGIGWGSSPRMRGTPRAVIPASTVDGLIPTYAGNTDVNPLESAPRRAHPHVCGEHSTGEDGVPEHKGSSPRMRGTRCPF